MTGLGREAKFLLDGASGGDEPTAENRARVRAAIAASLAAAAASGATVTALKSSGAPRGASASTLAIGVKASALVALALLVAAGVGAVYAPRGTPSNRPVPPIPRATTAFVERVPPVASARPTAVLPSAEPNAAPLEPAARVPVRPPPRPAVTPPSHPRTAGDSVEAEMGLIAEARDALRSGDAAAALASLDEHARRYPAGVLGEEEGALRVTALCALGRVADAHAEVTRFLRAFPASPHAARVRASCGGRVDPTF